MQGAPVERSVWYRLYSHSLLESPFMPLIPPGMILVSARKLQKPKVKRGSRWHINKSKKPVLGVKPNFVHLEQFRFTVHNSFETRTWPDPVHRLLTVVTSPRAPRRACPQVKRQQRIQCCSGLVGSHSSSDTPWCGVCRRRNITYLGSAWLVSIFASPGLHRHLRIIEVGKMHGTLSKAMRYKVSNC